MWEGLSPTSLQITNFEEDVEKREPSYTVGWNVNWYSYYEKQHGTSSKIKMELPYDPAIPLLGIYPEKMKTVIWKDTCTSVFTETLFTIVKTWKQPICPSTENWIKKIWYVYIHIVYAHTRKCVCIYICTIHNGILFI